MLVERSTVEKYIYEHMKDLPFKKNDSKKMYDYCESKYDIPGGKVADYVTGRQAIEYCSEFELFILMDGLREVELTQPNIIAKYFTAGEKEFYEKSKFHNSDEIKFPLIFKMLKVSNDQYVGTTDVNTLIKMVNSQIIKYNDEIQRVKQRVVRGEITYYKISLNKKAIREIATSLEDGAYIPNTITLNISPDNMDAEYYYDEKSCSFVINKIDKVDITDGYHRLVAMNRVIEKDSTFNYPMELRITLFEEDKAKNFIFQEDQKTQMNKIDSESFNMNGAANIVVERLNTSPQSDIKGMIKHSGGQMSPADLSECIKYFYFKDVNKADERIMIHKAIKDITESFNILIETDYSLLERQYSFQDILCIIYVFAKYKFTDKTNVSSEVEMLLNKLESSSKKVFHRKKINRTMVKEIRQLYN